MQRGYWKSFLQSSWRECSFITWEVKEHNFYMHIVQIWIFYSIKISYIFGECSLGYVIFCDRIDYSHLIVRNELKSEVKPKRTELNNDLYLENIATFWYKGYISFCFWVMPFISLILDNFCFLPKPLCRDGGRGDNQYSKITECTNRRTWSKKELNGQEQDRRKGKAGKQKE